MQIYIFYASYLIFPLIALFAYLFWKNKQTAKRIIFGLLIFICLLFIYARFIEPRMILTKYSRIAGGNNKTSCLTIKIAVIADLHAGVFKNTASLQKIVQKINKENPDIAVIPGDFVYKIEKDKIEQALFELSRIAAPAYAVTGNHDAGKPGKNVSKEIRSALKKYGIHNVDDAIERIEINGEKIAVVGLSDLWTGEADLSVLNQIKADEKAIVITHNPDLVYKFPKNAPADLVISGHTHGGQIRLPFLYRYAIPSEYGFDKGFYKINGVNVFVSSGIGMVGLPLRFMIPPVIDVLEINI